MVTQYKAQIITSSLAGIISPETIKLIDTAVDNWNGNKPFLEIAIPEVELKVWAINVSEIENSDNGVSIWSIGCGAGEYELSGDFLFVVPEPLVNLQKLNGNYVRAPIEAQDLSKPFEQFNQFITKELAYSVGGVTICPIIDEDEE